MTEAKSAMVVNENAVLDTLEETKTFHVIMISTISILAVVAEIMSVGQLDKVLDALQSMYTLFDTSAEYYAAQTARVDIGFERPYRYWLEKEHLNNVPPPADLGRFLARETIIGQDYSDQMKFWGFSEYWSDKYRRSRFVELPAEVIFQALHLKLIDFPEMKRLLRIADYNPDQLDLLAEMSYDYPNRTEIRVMTRRSSIPEKLITKALDVSGLREEYQPYLIETLLNWNIDSIRGRTINEGLGQFEKGVIQETALRLVLTESNASENETDGYVKLALLRRDGRRKSDRTASIRRAYRNGLVIKSEEYREELEKYLPKVLFNDATDDDIYKVLMMDLGFDLIDIELMLDDDRIRTKNVEIIESFEELLEFIRPVE